MAGVIHCVLMDSSVIRDMYEPYTVIKMKWVFFSCFLDFPEDIYTYDKKRRSQQCDPHSLLGVLFGILDI